MSPGGWIGVTHSHNHTSRYSDYVRTPSGLQYQDLRPGTGKDAREGAQVTVDWDGYTIGYYGRPFEARNKVAAPSLVPSSPAWAQPCWLPAARPP